MFPTINRTLNILVFREDSQPFKNIMRTPLFFLLLLLCCTNSVAQELTGPDRTFSGTLASFEIIPAQEASWHIVTPSSDTETYQVDTGSSKLYFASPVPGRYTVVAGVVVDGKPKLLVKTFVNGKEDAKPIPTPPIPPTTSLEMWIKTQTPDLVKSNNLVSESKLVAECFEQIVRQIDDEKIKTAQNARTQLQIALTATLAQASPTAVTDWTPFLTELSRRLETELEGKIDDLAEIKRVLQNVCDALKSFSTLTAPIQSIDTPNNRGTQNRLFRNLLAN